MIALNLRTPAGVNCIFEYIPPRASYGKPITRLWLEIFASVALSWEPFACQEPTVQKNHTIFVSIHTHTRACAAALKKHARGVRGGCRWCDTLYNM